MNGEAIFQPNISLVQLKGAIGMDFILNIVCFTPMGLLCPVISMIYGQMRKTGIT